MCECYFQIPEDLRQLVDAELAYHYRIVPSNKKEGKIVFKTDSETLKTLLPELQIVLGYPIDFIEETKDTIDCLLNTNYRK